MHRIGMALRQRRPGIIRFVWVCALLVVLARSIALAQTEPGALAEVRTLQLGAWGAPERGGLTYAASLNQFFLVKQGRPAQPETGATVIAFTPYEELVAVVELDFAIDAATNIAFDEQGNRLLLLNSQPAELAAVEVGSEEVLDPATLTRFDLAGLGLQSAQGLAMDDQAAALWILDSQARQLVRLALTPAGPELASLERLELAPLGLDQVRGLAVNPLNQHLVVMDGADHQVHELTPSGQLVRSFAMSALEPVAPRALVFAPSADLTDELETLHLFVLDSKQPEDQVAAAPSWLEQVASRVYLPLITQASGGADSPAPLPRKGVIVEAALAEEAAVQSAASEAVLATLVQIVDTSLFSPPSPDPSGIAYLPASGTLLISDAEVDEMPQYFTGNNLFEVSRAGTLLRTLTTIPFSDEPAGLEVNPVNNHLFIGDDTGPRAVYEVDLGADGIYGTADDSVTVIQTAAFGSTDPEGLAFDPSGAGTLYILDGLNREIYRLEPGANGRFDGIPPEGDDSLTQFDTLSLGLDDPEGLAFNPTTGTLYAVGRPPGLLFELTTTGALVQTHKLMAIRKPSGLTVAPHSRNPAQLSIYLVARGVDNDTDPNENDGKLYEFTLGQLSGTPTNTPLPPTPTNTPTPVPTDQPIISLCMNPLQDSYLRQDDPTKNYGAENDLKTKPDAKKERRVVIGFDLAAIPPASKVLNAKLRLYEDNKKDGQIITLYRLTNSWVEGQVTWNHRSAGTPWVTPGGEFEGTPLATFIPYLDKRYRELTVTAVAQGWVNGSYRNDGLLLRAWGLNGEVKFKSREVSKANQKPELCLTYQQPPPPTPSPTPTPTNTPVIEPVVLAGAGDIADCARVQDEQTAQLLDTIPGTVFTLGDNAYPAGTAADFATCYEPTWGRHKARTRPAVGDGEYATPGAAGYFDYFGAAAGDRTKGYYSYDLGSWHIIVLNSECIQVGGCDATSVQGEWLRADLAANPRTCTLAIMHKPFFSSSGSTTSMRDFWMLLHAAGADIVLSGHRHNYERFALQNPDGVADPAHGVRQFVVGTGGGDLGNFSTIAPNSEVRNNTTHGVLKLTLYPTSYEWAFIPVAGQTFTDTGSAPCVTP